MKYLARAFFGAIVCFSISAPAMGQERDPAAAYRASEPADPTTIVLSPEAARAAIRRGSIYRVGNQTFVAFDLLAGSLMAIRLRVPTVNFTDRVRLNLEGYYGGGITTVGIGPIAGGGLRIRINAAEDRAHQNAFFISPGTDLLVTWDENPGSSSWIDFGPDGTVFFLTADTDLTWVHQFATHFGLELGLRLGGAVSLGGPDSSGRESRGRLTPVLSLLAGVRF